MQSDRQANQRTPESATTRTESPLDLAQILMNELHSHGTLAHTRRDSLHRAVAHVSDGKDSRNIRFQQKGITLKHPPFRSLAVSYQVRTRQDKTTIVPFDQACQPVGPGQGPNKDEHRTCRYAFNLVRIRAQYRDFLQSLVSMEFGNAGVSPYLNIGSLLDLVDQILGHRRGEAVTAYQKHNFFGIPGKVHRGLAGGICTANDVDNFALTRERLRGATAVVDPGALQLVDSRSFQAPPLHTGCEQQCMTRDLASIGQLDDSIGTFGTDAHGFLRCQDLDSKTLSLHDSASRKVTSAQPAWKSQIVFNARAHSCLSAGSFALDHHRLQAFRGPINSRSQAGGASSND